MALAVTLSIMAFILIIVISLALLLCFRESTFYKFIKFLGIKTSKTVVPMQSEQQIMPDSAIV